MIWDYVGAIRGVVHTFERMTLTEMLSYLYMHMGYKFSPMLPPKIPLYI